MTTPAPGRRSAVAAAAARRLAALRSSRRRRRRRRLIAAWVVAALIAGTASFAAGLVAAPIDFAAPPQPASALLLDDSGHLFATIRSSQVEQVVPAADIPRVMRQAIVAAEDERFFSHPGVDPLAMVRALARDLTGAHLQGGSTITQQYVKNVYVGRERTLLRKLREAALAVRLEQHLTKDEILTRYLNSLYLGNGTYGVQAAATFYFGVGIANLDLDPVRRTRSPLLALARASLLAGMVPAPSVWNPLADPNAARSRELYTLNRMIANRMVTSQDASAAYALGMPRIVAYRAPDLPTIAPEFRDLVEADLRRRFGDDEVDRGGLRVVTTLDLDVQKAAVAALAQVLPSATDPEAAVVAIDPRTGDLRALTTKRDGGYRKHGYDIATMAPRSSGSTVKPFTLAVALEEGHSLDETRYAANCIVVPYHVCNADIAESGTFTLAEALALSVNTVYAPLFVQVGMSRVLALAHAAGMATPTGTPDDFRVPYPAKGLGVTVSPLSEAVAFATLADHGVRHDPRMLVSVASQDGGASYHAGSPAGRRVLPAGIDNEVTTAMQGVVDHGTGTLAAQPFPVYGKTGTTSNYDDAWFTGCTPALCIAVWMGYDKPRSMTQVEGVHDVVGGSLPAEIFAHTWDNLRALHAAESLAPGSPVPSVPASAAGTSPAPAPAPSLTPSPSTPASPTHQPSPGRSPGSSPSPTATQPSSPPLPIPTPSGPVPSAASRSP